MAEKRYRIFHQKAASGNRRDESKSSGSLTYSDDEAHEIVAELNRRFPELVHWPEEERDRNDGA